MARRDDRLTPEERTRLDALAAATGLADLRELVGAESEEAAYFAAKTEWRTLRERALAPPAPLGGIPGRVVTIDGHRFHVHGVTHADTTAERSFLRGRVERLIEGGAVVYCEQGLRRLYFDDMPTVCEMDDYAWAVREGETPDEVADDPFAGRLDPLVDRFRTIVFGLIDDGAEVYGDRFRAALGDVASGLLTGHADLATGDGFEAFARHRRAATDPTKLADLQHYYEVTFLPQPVEREWLARHAPEVEVVTHGRNARMADYAAYHNENATDVHLIVGAAHQPGVCYYLRQIRDGDRSVDSFDLAT